MSWYAPIARLNRFADAIENRLPWFSWNRWGDPVSWVHHLLWALLVACIGRMVGGSDGQVAGAFAACSFYALRETVSVGERWRAWRAGDPHGPLVDRSVYGPTVANGFAPQRGVHVGFVIDSTMDQVGPLLVLLIS